jgi:phosphate transport system substrate-binding protein
MVPSSLILATLLLSGPDAPLRAAGSGTALPAVRALATAYREVEPGFSLIVAESIGSTGAVLALRDGAVDLGLTSRPLQTAEREGICEIPFASDLVVVAASPDVKASGLSSEQLLQVFKGELTVWPGSDPPLPIRVLQREASDSGSQVLASRIPGLGEALQRALEQGRWRVLFHDVEMQQALLQSKGAIGVFDLGAIRAQKLAVHALALDGAPPTIEALEQGRYPYAKTLSFLVRAKSPRPPALKAFLAFAGSKRGLAILRENGYAAPTATTETCH